MRPGHRLSPEVRERNDPITVSTRTESWQRLMWLAALGCCTVPDAGTSAFAELARVQRNSGTAAAQCPPDSQKRRSPPASDACHQFGQLTAGFHGLPDTHTSRRSQPLRPSGVQWLASPPAVAACLRTPAFELAADSPAHAKARNDTIQAVAPAVGGGVHRLRCQRNSRQDQHHEHASQEPA